MAHQGDLKMPPGSKAPAPPQQLNMIKSWIDVGAPWTEGVDKKPETSWWSLSGPVKPAAPQLSESDPKNWRGPRSTHSSWRSFGIIEARAARGQVGTRASGVFRSHRTSPNPATGRELYQGFLAERLLSPRKSTTRKSAVWRALGAALAGERGRRDPHRGAVLSARESRAAKTARCDLRGGN
jgi:hypothetical protein